MMLFVLMPSKVISAGRHWKCWTAMALLSSVDFSKTKQGLQAFGRAVLLAMGTQVPKTLSPLWSCRFVTVCRAQHVAHSSGDSPWGQRK